jgi:hypothetical protein
MTKKERIFAALLLEMEMNGFYVTEQHGYYYAVLENSAGEIKIIGKKQ